MAKSLRMVCAWIAGLLTAFVLYGAFDFSLNAIGVPTYTDFGETVTVSRGSGGYSYDEDIDGASTAIGLSAGFLSMIAGVYAGTAVSKGRLDAGFSRKDVLQTVSLVIGLFVYGIVGAGLYALFGDRQGLVGALHDVLQLGGAGLGFLIARCWYLAALRRSKEG